ncbi:hypothetical protein AZ602_01690 [Moraxella sp. RCAD0137]|nr:hypothetical protein AZ602_01690 [Moraxella sp. RCAD0137]
MSNLLCQLLVLLVHIKKAIWQEEQIKINDGLMLLAAVLNTEMIALEVLFLIAMAYLINKKEKNLMIACMIKTILFYL